MREVAAATVGCHAVDAPVSKGDVGARDSTLAMSLVVTRSWSPGSRASRSRCPHLGAHGRRSVGYRLSRSSSSQGRLGRCQEFADKGAYSWLAVRAVEVLDVMAVR
jgi:hypothetical protein